MKRNRQRRKSAKEPTQSIHYNIVELALCHVAELIGLAQDIANNMHSGMAHPELIFHVSGRLATLMYCAKRELDEAREKLPCLAQGPQGCTRSTSILCRPPDGP